ncbi:MAG: sporulation protein YunB [Ruminococcus sp.]|nr:sporulation protein YunB [Ruminococcus sp.]
MKRKKHKKDKEIKSIIGAILFLTVIILLITAIVRIEKSICPVAVNQAIYYSRTDVNKTISGIISEYLEENRYTYNDFAVVLYDSEKKVASVETLSYNINKVQSELSLEINEEFSEASGGAIEIPLGTLMNSYLLAGKGPVIRLRVCPARDAEVKLTSTFENAGINQTKHRISAVITTEINSSIPLYSFSTKTSYEFLIAENIIVGEIPQLYMN